MDQKASLSAFNSLSGTVTAQGNSITATANAVTALDTTVGNFSASGRFRVNTTTTESGASSTIALSTSATDGGATSQAALLISAVAGGTSMIGLVADKVYFTDGAGNKAYPFVFTGGIAYMENARIGDLYFRRLRSFNGKLDIRGDGSNASIEITT